MSDSLNDTAVERVVIRFYGELTDFRCKCRPHTIKSGDVRVAVLRDSAIQSIGSTWYRAQIICPFCEMIFLSGLIPESDAIELEDFEN